jgi:hypothetical protein
MAADQEIQGFYCSADGNVTDDFIAKSAGKLVEINDTFIINGTAHVRTKKGQVLKN